MITPRTIAAADRNQLREMKQNLLSQRNSLDKFFTVFLNKYELDPTRPDTPEWVTYNEMSKDYSRIQQLLNQIHFYVTR